MYTTTLQNMKGNPLDDKQLPPSWPNEISGPTRARYYFTNFTLYESSGRTIDAIDVVGAVYVIVLCGMVTNGVLSRRRK